MEHYRLEIVEGNVVARYYVGDRKTTIYLTIIPDHLKSSAAAMQLAEDSKPF